MWYVLAALALTWPTVAGLTRDIPWDLGDSLLNGWVFGWDADHLWRFIRGDFGALHGFWNANIFGSEPLALDRAWRDLTRMCSLDQPRSTFIGPWTRCRPTW